MKENVHYTIELLMFIAWKDDCWCETLMQIRSTISEWDRIRLGFIVLAWAK